MNTIPIETKEHIPPVTKADIVEDSEREHIAISFIAKPFTNEEGNTKWIACMPMLGFNVVGDTKEEAISTLKNKLIEIEPDLEIVGLVSKDETDE